MRLPTTITPPPTTTPSSPEQQEVTIETIKMKRFICEISDFLDMKMKKKTEEDYKKKAEGFPPQIPTPDYNIKKIAESTIEALPTNDEEEKELIEIDDADELRNKEKKKTQQTR